MTSQSETGTIYTITVRHVNEVHYGDYAYQQVFNLLMRTCIRALGLQLVGRDFYDPDPRVKVRSSFFCHPSFFLSFIVTLCIEIKLSEA